MVAHSLKGTYTDVTQLMVCRSIHPTIPSFKSPPPPAISSLTIFTGFSRLESLQECIPVGCVTSAAVAVSPAMRAPLPHIPPLPHTSPCHAHPLPCMPPLPCTPPPCHTCPPAMHAPPPHTPPCHTCPLPCMPPHHTHTPATHAPLTCTPPPCHTCPQPCTHPLPCTSPPPWTEFLTHACENITFPQLLLRTVKSCNMVVERGVRKWYTGTRLGLGK